MDELSLYMSYRQLGVASEAYRSVCHAKITKVMTSLSTKCVGQMKAFQIYGGYKTTCTMMDMNVRAETNILFAFGDGIYRTFFLKTS